jgi:hypothetical protein
LRDANYHSSGASFAIANALALSEIENLTIMDLTGMDMTGMDMTGKRR